MLTIRMYSHQELDWIDIRIHEPGMMAVLLNLLKKEETIPKMAKEFRDAGLIKEKEEA